MASVGKTAPSITLTPLADIMLRNSDKHVIVVFDYIYTSRTFKLAWPHEKTFYQFGFQSYCIMKNKGEGMKYYYKTHTCTH